MSGKAPTDRSSPEYKAWRRDYDRERWAAQKERLTPIRRRYYAENVDAINAQKRGYWAENRERMAATAKAWRSANPHVIRDLNNRRKAAIARATPPWADHAAIRKIYEAAARLTVETGIQHHVDHEVPLKGRNVCGLHVETNLRPLPWLDNLKKKNKLLPEVVSPN